MARRIIILDRKETHPDTWIFRYALWVPTPPDRVPFYVNARATTEVLDATLAERNALIQGQVLERIEGYEWSKGAPIAEIQADLITRWNAFQQEIIDHNPWIRYGTYWDDNAQWHVVTIN